MAQVERLVPALPVTVMAGVFLDRLGEALEESVALDLGEARVEQLRAAGAVIGIPGTARRYALASGLEMLVLRHIVDTAGDDRYTAPETSSEILAYYANSVAVFMEPGDAAT